MNFWDRFVLCLYYGLSETLPVGRDVAASLFGEAFLRGRLMPAQLNDLSLLLLLGVCPAGSPIQPDAEQAAFGRGLHQQPGHAWALLSASRPTRLQELLELGRLPAPSFRVLVASVLAHPNLAEVYNNLCEGLGRLLLVDPVSQQQAAQAYLFRAIRRYVAMPLGTMEFTCLLYLDVLARIRPPGTPLPSALPAGVPPGWFAALASDEQGVIQRCLAHLTEAEWVFLAVQLYGRLTVEQIACVLRQSDATITADQVARELERAWLKVL
jgi:hypothetical protein